MTVAFACAESCGLRPHLRAARRDAGSTARLLSAPRSGSRGANLLPPSGRETIRAAIRRLPYGVFSFSLTFARGFPAFGATRMRTSLGL